MRQPSSRRYPRTARVNKVVREVLAEELERMADSDDRIGLLTVTHVEVDPDLRRATVLFSSLSDQAREVLDEERHNLQSAIGRQVRMKHTPQLLFAEDPAIQTGARVEEILRSAQSRPIEEEQ
jgi:ribosome-binding factor A